MKLIVKVPLQATREYLYDYMPETIPSVNDVFDDKYIVKKKIINRDVCTLELSIRKGCSVNE